MLSEAIWDDSDISLRVTNSTFALVGVMEVPDRPDRAEQVDIDLRMRWLLGQDRLAHAVDLLAQWEEDFALLLIRGDDDAAAAGKAPLSRLLVVLRLSDTASAAFQLIGGTPLGHVILITQPVGRMAREGEDCTILWVPDEPLLIAGEAA